MTTVYIALGTNVGDRERNLREALRLLVEAGIRIIGQNYVQEAQAAFAAVGRRHAELCDVRAEG